MEKPWALRKPISIRELADIADANQVSITIDLEEYGDILTEMKIDGQGRIPNMFSVSPTLYHVSLDPKDKE